MNFKVQVQPGGKNFVVEPNESVLDAALRQGVALPYGCRNGTCGACKGKLLAGKVGYKVTRPPALSDAEMAEGFALYCQAQPLGDIVIEFSMLDQCDRIVRTLPARVIKKELLSHDVMRIFLKLPASQRLPFLAGQYIDFLLPDGRHRSFSLANAPHDDEFLELHIRHVDQGEFTEYVFEYMKEKSLVRIEGPHGDFFLREDSPRPIILVAGGTGFAPLKGIIEHAFAEGMTRPMHLYWGVRNSADLYLDKLPQQWVQEYANFRYTPVLSAATGQWRGRTGYVSEAVVADYSDLGEFDLYAAGPPAMVKATRDACCAQGLPSQQFFSDPFEFAPDARAKQQHQK